MRCLVDSGELKKICQAIFWSVGQFDEDTGAPIPVRIGAGSSVLTFSVVNKDNFVEFKVQSRVEFDGVAFVSFPSLKSLCEYIETSILYFSIKDGKFIIESEDGRILLNSLQMAGWEYPDKPEALTFRCQSFLLNRISRQMMAASNSSSENKTMAIKYSKKHQSLWLEYVGKGTSCLGKLFCRGDADTMFTVSTAKFCNMMRAITSWHVAETKFIVQDDFSWFSNGHGLFRIKTEKQTNWEFGKTHMEFQEKKPLLQRVNLMRSALVSILETCVASDPDKDVVRLDWVNSRGQDTVRVFSRGSRCDVVRYSTSQGLINRPVILPARRMLDFLKTYMDPIAQFEVGPDICYISIPKQVRFGICQNNKLNQ